MALYNNPEVDCRSELVREEHASEPIANKFAPTNATLSPSGWFSGLLYRAS